MWPKVTTDFLKSQTLRIWVAAAWLIFTSAMVIWWWSLGITELQRSLGQPELQRSLGQSELQQGLSLHAASQTKYRMMMWEGGFFLFAILAGGGFLIFLLLKDFQRQKQVKMFFATFSHDLKTSIARLRLQADVLREDNLFAKNRTLEILARDIDQLDLQLENSLILSQGSQRLSVEENLPLSNFIEALRRNWENLEISLEREAWLRGDRRTILSLFRNLIQNSVNHGGATKIIISPREHGPGAKLRILVKDNGRGFSGDPKQLGLSPLPSQEDSGNGIGLFLCKNLLLLQKGELVFENDSSQGFVAQITIPGSLSAGRGQPKQKTVTA